MNPEYAAFLARKAPRAQTTGIEPRDMPAHMDGFRGDVTAFAIRQGRAGVYLDTGLGKTSIQLEWAQQALEATNGRALILTPLAVAKQIELEAKRWGYDARVIRDMSRARDGINICNYDRLGLLDPDEFGAVACDESSIVKNFSGATTRALIDFTRNHRFKLAATATPAPNDHMELGQQSDLLGIMSSNEMLIRWFINDTSTASQSWRLKKHGETDFWDWMASWSRCASSPEDLGYDGSAFVLPELRVIRHKAVSGAIKMDGLLFAEDVSATNMHALKRQTSGARADLVASLVDAEPAEPWLIWCDTDNEADALKARIGNVHEVRGSMKPEQKEELLIGFGTGVIDRLITKPGIAGMGLNYQRCARQAFVGRSFSYEAWYQCVRRSWRFGQTRPVNVHLAVAEGEDQIGRVIDRKGADHERMKVAMRAAMLRASGKSSQVKIPYNPTHNGRMPQWLLSA